MFETNFSGHRKIWGH